MCGRFNLTVDSAASLARSLQAELASEDAALFRPRYNVAPTQLGWMLHLKEGRRRLSLARWGFPSRGGKLLINARSETAAKLPSFRDAWRARRCVIPSTGFYEWEGGPKDRRPIWFHPPDRGLLLLGGLYQPGEEGRERFVILTTQANETVARAHDRMPAIVFPEELSEWLREPPAAPLEPGPAAGLIATPVSKRLNQVVHDDPSCLDPPAKGEQGERDQLELF